MALNDDIPLPREPRFGQSNTVNRMHALYRFTYRPKSSSYRPPRLMTTDIHKAIALAERRAHQKRVDENWQCYGYYLWRWISMDAGVMYSDVQRYFGGGKKYKITSH